MYTMGRNGHGPKWLWAEMTRNHYKYMSQLMFVSLQMPPTSKRVNTTATARLRQDYMRIMKDPVPYVRAAPLPSNILEW